MKDEEQLASLVLLLQLPSTTDVTNDIEASELQRTLEHNDCNLLCFIGRLVNSYALEEEASASEPNEVKHTLLRLAVRVLLMRYAAYATNQSHMTRDMFDGRIFEWEKSLLKSLLGAVSVNTKIHSDAIQNVDVEMAWVIVGLLMKWSGEVKEEPLCKEIENLWIESINVLMARHQVCATGPRDLEKSHSTCQNSTAANNDDSLMVQTINSILDGSDENEVEWDEQFNTAVASCLRAFIETFSEPRVASSILLGMIQWSQQKDEMCLDLYCIVLQYLSTCLRRVLEGENGKTNHMSYQQNADKYHSYFFCDKSDKSSSGDTFIAIKSFLFYGLIVLCNNPDKNFQINRGEMYSLFLGLWQLLGPEWLYENDTTSNSNGSASGIDWWQRSDFANSKDNNNRLGQTWQLCTLVRLAAGEFRLSLGRWMACIEGQREDKSGVSEINACAQIIVEAVQLMTSLADDEDEDVMDQTEGQNLVWTPDAILHVRQSLQDALNAAIQYFNENEELLNKDCDSNTSNKMENEMGEIGRTCCLILGTIAPELELDHLLNTGNEQNSHASFANAMCTSILFCGTFSKKRQQGTSETKHSGQEEPLSYLLSCIMSIVDIASSEYDEENLSVKDSAEKLLVILCKKGQLMQIMCTFLDRLQTQFNTANCKFDQHSHFSSILRLFSIIVNGLLELGSSDKSTLQFTSPESNKLSAALMQFDEL